MASEEAIRPSVVGAMGSSNYCPVRLRIDQGGSSSSAPAIEATMASGCFLFRVAGYSLIKDRDIDSLRFSAGGCTWHVNYRNKASSACLSFCLVLDDRVAEPMRARCNCKFSLLDRAGKPAPPCSRVTRVRSPILDWSTNTILGWQDFNFITAEDLEAGPDYLVDDCFTVRCDITFADKLVGAAEARALVSVPPSDLHRHLGDLMLREEGADVAFEVGGKTFAAHRCVLAARSPVFRAELFGPMKESAAFIRVDDMEAQVFSSLLTFVYTDSLPETDDSGQDEGAMAQHLLAAADRYGLERMKLICEERLREHIHASSVATVLALAEQYRCRGLKEACFKFLSSGTNLKAFTETDGFEQLVSCCPSVLKELLAKLATLVIS